MFLLLMLTYSTLLYVSTLSNYLRALLRELIVQFQFNAINILSNLINIILPDKWKEKRVQKTKVKVQGKTITIQESKSPANFFWFTGRQSRKKYTI